MGVGASACCAITGRSRRTRTGSTPQGAWMILHLATRCRCVPLISNVRAHHASSRKTEVTPSRSSRRGTPALRVSPVRSGIYMEPRRERKLPGRKAWASGCLSAYSCERGGCLHSEPACCRTDYSGYGKQCQEIEFYGPAQQSTGSCGRISSAIVRRNAARRSCLGTARRRRSN